ncbi:MAG: exonuclease SbcCD subunit D C-terminal domain-containing protein [Magnetococcales bacterium]|nr:exonuclease SbcCD subunit D C-terminal domain-containing protein [Magnetococcales bacterium]
MKIIHTADWHLGHELHGFSRTQEQGAFLQWLSATLHEQEVDVLIVAGDLFDTVNPSSAAQNQLYQFIRTNHQNLPHLQTVLIGGNHDSANRLEAPNPLFHTFGVHSLGRLPKGKSGLDWEKIFIPLQDKNGQQRAILAAIPYLRPGDLPPPSQFEGDPLIEGVRWIYEQTLAEADKRMGPNCGLILTGHCYMQGGEISQLSERRIIGGGEQALPASLFPESVTYVALGHLHRGQRVGGRERVRYSGSPLPLSVTERDYCHAVRLITLDDGGQIAKQTSLKVPRTVPYLRVPSRGALPLAQALAALEALPLADPDPGHDFWPFLEVAIQLTGPEPGLRSQIDQALAGKPVRLAGIRTETPGQQRPLADVAREKSLDEIEPGAVFRLLHQQRFNQAPEVALCKAFDEIVIPLINADPTTKERS